MSQVYRAFTLIAPRAEGELRFVRTTSKNRVWEIEVGNDIAINGGEPAALQNVPSNHIQHLVEPVVERVLSRTGGAGIEAIAVVGSAARGEETWRDGHLAGDIDLALVLHSPNPFTAARIVKRAGPVPDGISLGVFPAYSIRRYRSIEFYEARETAWVVWGNRHVFDAVPVQSAADIPKWEGLRLVLNRAMHCIEARAGRSTPAYAAVKSYLALAEADLIFRGTYAPSYHARWNRIRAMGAVLGSRELFHRVAWATSVKLHGSPLIEPDDPHQHERWLMQGLGTLFSAYLGREVDAITGLAGAAMTQRRLAHRVASLARHICTPQCWAGAVTQDPMFAVWNAALHILQSGQQPRPADLPSLLQAWETTHQPLLR